MADLKTYFGFPVGNGKPAQRQKGVSLLIAVMVTSIMISLIADMIVSSSVQVELASSSRDKVRAEYLAKSGFNLALMLISVSQLKDLIFAKEPFKQPAYDSPSSIWAMFNSLPPLGAATADLALAAAKMENDPYGLKGVMNAKVGEQMRLLEDELSFKVIDESSRININNCINGRCSETLEQLQRLFSCPVEKRFLAEKNIEPHELAYRIKDFIHKDGKSSPESGIDGESYYGRLEPPYAPKKLGLDSLEELRLIAGFDDEVFAVFAPYLTVYPFVDPNNKEESQAQININTSPKELISCLVPSAEESSCADGYHQSMHKMSKKKTAFAQNKDGLKKQLQKVACYKEEKEDKVRPAEWFDVKARVFRLEVKAQTGKQKRRLEAVIQRLERLDDASKKQMGKHKHYYRVLHWKLS